jgi:Tfp pilus assembly protein PilV
VIRRIPTNPNSANRARRAGLSLLEVVVALAILAFSVVAIGQLISMSSDHAVDVEREAQGSLLCQRKLAELLIGPDVPGTTSYADFPDDEPSLQYWQWKADVNPGVNGLVYQVQVSVKFDAGDSRAVEIQLGQMILDPTQRGSNQDPPANQSSSSTSAASAATPSASTPSASTPSASTPSASTPSASTPSSSKATTPSSSKTGP